MLRVDIILKNVSLSVYVYIPDQTHGQDSNCNLFPSLFRAYCLFTGGWDMGDCCEETCDDEYSFYPCGGNQVYSCMNPNAGGSSSQTSPTGGSVEASPFYFHDGFEADDFDSSHWKWLDGSAAWEIEREADTASEGTSYAEAQTKYIVNDSGESILELQVDSLNGGSLSYQVQALIQAPYEDVLVKVDNVAVDILMNAIPSWTLREVAIEPGEHVIQWVHRKNPSAASDEELAVVEPNLGITRIDDVTFYPY